MAIDNVSASLIANLTGGKISPPSKGIEEDVKKLLTEFLEERIGRQEFSARAAGMMAKINYLKKMRYTVLPVLKAAVSVFAIWSWLEAVAIGWNKFAAPVFGLPVLGILSIYVLRLVFTLIVRGAPGKALFDKIDKNIESEKGNPYWLDTDTKGMARDFMSGVMMWLVHAFFYLVPVSIL